MKFAKTLLLLVVFFAAGFLVTHRLLAQNAKSVGKYNSKKDKIVTPVRQNLENLLTLTGSIAALNQADLRFQSSGRLVWVGVKEGDTVKKGQAIASLDKTELQKQYRKYMNDYLTNRWDFEDTQNTYKTTREKYLVTDEIKRILERANFSLDNAVLDVEIKDIALKNAVLTSPIAGLVTYVEQPHSGVNITPTTATFTIIDPDSLYFKSEIDQEDVTKVRLHQPATVRLDSFPDKTFESEITYISFTPVTGQTSTVYQLRFTLPVDNQNQLYRLGMDGDAVVSLDQATDALTIVTDAVFEENSKKYVYLLRADQLEKTEVTTGIETDTTIEIRSGLSSSDQVVIRKK